MQDCKIILIYVQCTYIVHILYISIQEDPRGDRCMGQVFWVFCVLFPTDNILRSNGKRICTPSYLVVHFIGMKTRVRVNKQRQNQSLLSILGSINLPDRDTDRCRKDRYGECLQSRLVPQVPFTRWQPVGQECHPWVRPGWLLPM